MTLWGGLFSLQARFPAGFKAGRKAGLQPRLAAPLAALGFFSFALAMLVRLAFDESVPANPYSSSAWIDRGLAVEHAGNLIDAENALLEAARVDHQYLPAWTLANFYFRRGQAESFWPWAARAAALNYDDLRPLLKLCDLIEPDPGASLDHLGDTPRNEHAYLDFLIGQNRLDAAQQVARRMLARHDPRETPRLADLVDREIRAGRGEAALDIWNALARSPRLDPAAGAVLTNGELKTAPSGAGFDWRLPSAVGLTVEWRPSELDFALWGTQPESCVLLEQALLLDKTARRYHLRFEYSTPTGIRWALDTSESTAFDPSDAWRAGQWIFALRPSGLARLKLIYRREPGTIRAQGHVKIRNVRLEVL
jgi:tetratricopeptide (TPR) repeat protein